MYQYHKWLRSFHAVARTGNFTQAADFLSLGQPTVSEQVAALERKFAIELLHRRGRSTVLTDAGHQLYAITQGLFGQEDEAIQLLQSFHQKKTGLIRIGAVSPPIAMSLTYELMRRHPEIEVGTSFTTEAETLERLYNFDIDVAILALTDFDRRLHTELYRSCPIVAMVRHDHPWTTQKSVQLHEIESQALVLREQGSRTRQLVESACLDRGIKLNCVMQLNSREAIVHSIAQGIGIGFVSEVEYAELPGTRAIRFANDPLHIDYFLCCLGVRRNRALIADLFDSCPGADPPRTETAVTTGDPTHNSN
ncbi:LysR substrate-binding domain-containing protein [Pseudomonas stutzeri]|uniref:LysR substrate-binding domain-containing protein n=1 Tax=Stutzerimonas stutzeri TaxID=316 RepID=UPI002108EBC8|nr:LysR substrate-binding domain-containing protein [Stutzerimonas stutzeri]MCQ4288174.1 LysR substrate-binding domain-containing protein [Stutzerimonas stutzeri]